MVNGAGTNMTENIILTPTLSTRHILLNRGAVRAGATSVIAPVDYQIRQITLVNFEYVKVEYEKITQKSTSSRDSKTY